VAHGGVRRRTLATYPDPGRGVRYQVAFRGRWEGALLHAFTDVDPRWDDVRRATVVTVADHAALVSLVNRASDLGTTILSVEPLEAGED
jgi:hypothetical protein